MLVAVVDSNVYVSALVFGGTPALALQLAAAGRFQLIVSETIQAEVEETLTRKFGWDAKHFSQAALELWETAQIVSPAHMLSASRDPDDDRVLACAVEGRGQIIITGDRDLLSLNPFGKIEILSPADFLRRF
jgi:putative PIN family toxin of toxin-antitoxin system